jgi:hypothetical protein
MKKDLARRGVKGLQDLKMPFQYSDYPAGLLAVEEVFSPIK